MTENARFETFSQPGRVSCVIAMTVSEEDAGQVSWHPDPHFPELRDERNSFDWMSRIDQKFVARGVFEQPDIGDSRTGGLQMGRDDVQSEPRQAIEREASLKGIALGFVQVARGA